MDKCRLCYTDPNPEMCKHIFNTKFEPPIWKIIEQLSNLIITKNDPYTKNICGPCFIKLVKYSDFRTQILDTDYRIQHEKEQLSQKTSDDYDYFEVHYTPTRSDNDDFIIKEEQIEIEEHHLKIDDDDKSKELAKKLAKKRTNRDIENVSPVPKKRIRKPKKTCSFTSSDTTKPNKKVIRKVNSKIPSSNLEQNTNGSETENQSEEVKSDAETRSPTKEELKKIIVKQQQLLAQVSKSNNVSISDNETDEDNENEDGIEKYDSVSDKSSTVKETALTVETDGAVSPQLYGQNSGQPMVLLRDNIYCTKRAFIDAVDLSRKSATSFLRRIMDGVFKRSEIMNCTFSGRPPNAQGAERQSQKMESLDRNARNAVIEFCGNYASQQGWPQSSYIELRRAMSQWLGEVKRQESKNINKRASFC